MTLQTVSGILSVQIDDKDLNLAPLFPSEGDCYICTPLLGILTIPWLGHAYEVALFEEGAWTFYTPPDGVIMYVRDEASIYQRQGSGYVKLTQTDLNNLATQTVITNIMGSPTFPSSPVTATAVRDWLLAHNYIGNN